MNTKRYLMTASLLNAWLWSFKSDEGFEDFLKALNRESTAVNKYILDGRQFENMVSRWNEGFPADEDHEWYSCIKDCAELLQGSEEQVKAYAETVVDGVRFLLYGKLDNLKRGVIYDTKFSETYQFGKYVESPQHPMYFKLVPEANTFIYLVADGKNVYAEEYRRFDTPPIELYIRRFMKYLKEHGLETIYKEKWLAA